jgi:hypothetical protein
VVLFGDASRLASGADAETSESAGWWLFRRRRPVRGSDGTPPSKRALNRCAMRDDGGVPARLHEGGASAADVLAARRTESAGPQRSKFRLRTAGLDAVTLAGARSKTAGNPATGDA